MPLLGDPWGATVAATDPTGTRPADRTGSVRSIGFSGEPRSARIREVDMRSFGPLLTLLAVAVLGGALLTLDTVTDPTVKTGTPSAASPAPVAAPGPAASPATSAPPAPAQKAPVVAQEAYAGRSAGNEVTVAIAVK